MRWKRLDAILETLLPARFSFSPSPAAADETLAGSADLDAPCKLSTLTQPSGAGVQQEESDTIEVKFSDSRSVPFPFRGRSVRTNVFVRPEILVLRDGEELLASYEHGPIWAASSRNGTNHFRSGLTPPALPEGGMLREVFNGERFLELLPMVHWLLKICADSELEGPAPGACFIFDDPNLHWPTYGCVNYREIAARAERKNYHVSFAAIPLDTWFTHGPTAEIFRRHTGRLSLCVHGNNHSKRELARDYTGPQRAALLGQALDRIGRLERKSGLRVSRVMIPPHGACSESMLAQLPRSGFLGACISHGSIVAHNKSCAWAKCVGFKPSEMVDGCLVMPRWGLTGNTTNAILLAAFLKQPLIFRGHHQDLRDGIEILDELADTINHLGPVTWTDLTTLSQGTYQWRMNDGVCRIKPRCRKIEIQTPRSATHLVLESPGNSGWKSWRITSSDSVTEAHTGEVLALRSPANGALSIEAIITAPVPAGAHPNPPSAGGALARRLLTEGRDRILK